jgi:glutamate racemase
MAVGVFDSGLGGLTVLDAVRRRLPDVPFVYLGDNAHAPYGVRTADDIFALTCAAVERLWAEGCDLVILACNTASAAALKRMQETWLPPEKRVLGVFVPLIEALTERQWGDNSPPREVDVKHVALFATPATVASRAFQRELAFRAIGVDVEAQPCGGVVDAIEQGDEILAEALVRSHVQHPLPADGGGFRRGAGAGCAGVFAGQSGRGVAGRLSGAAARDAGFREGVTVFDHRGCA